MALTTVANRVQRLCDVLAEGVCPAPLLLKVVDEEIVAEGDVLPARDLLRLVRTLERADRGMPRAAGAGGAERRTVARLLDELRGMLGLAMLNSGGLDGGGQ